MRYSHGDIASASQRILSIDPELNANIENLAQAKHRLSWLPAAAKGLRRLAKIPEPEEAPTLEGLAVPELELESIVQRQTKRDAIMADQILRLLRL